MNDAGNLVIGTDGEQNLLAAEALRAEREKVCPKRTTTAGPFISHYSHFCHLTRSA